MKRILTGDRPTGKLHLGHYVGSLKNRVKLQDEYETYIIIADLHALTTKPSLADTKKFKENIHEMMLDYLSVGLNPEKVTFYIQSMIPELFTIFSMLTTVPRLERIPSLKDVMRDAHLEQPSFGLLGYPALQSADILMVRANLVPVGKDQESHLEITREIARDFNKTYSEVFPVPEALIIGGTLPGLDGAGKMSKSAGNDIKLSDSVEEVEKKVMSMYTDPTRIKATDPGHVEGNPVFIYLDAFCDEREVGEVGEYKKRYLAGEVGDVEVKKYLVGVLNRFLEPIRQKRAEYEAKPEVVEKILREGTEKAREEAQKTLLEVKRAMELNYF
jgi:tryptophanyl-tRNA synthetase